uniref:Uncharacterized protein n=1 Tax=Anguilla anguilla TaxID=7936 RepID=A0A0E9WP13_ANGAN
MYLLKYNQGKSLHAQWSVKTLRDLMTQAGIEGDSGF